MIYIYSRTCTSLPLAYMNRQFSGGYTYPLGLVLTNGKQDDDDITKCHIAEHGIHRASARSRAH